MRRQETTNEAERAFLEQRLKDPHQHLNIRQTALIFKSIGKARFKARPRESYVYVVQIGRFPNDTSYWANSLSTQDIAPLKNGTKLRFKLSSKEDFQHFEDAMQNELNAFQWSALDDLDTEDTEEG